LGTVELTDPDAVTHLTLDYAAVRENRALSEAEAVIDGMRPDYERGKKGREGGEKEKRRTARKRTSAALLRNSIIFNEA
jgi:hypothetical protein